MVILMYNAENVEFKFSRLRRHLKHGLHITVLKFSTYQLQIFLVKYEYLQSLQLCEDQGIIGKFKQTCLQTCACDPSDL